MSVTSITVPVNGFANEVTDAKDVREDISMILRYDEPASDWESEALPIGNGNIGAMVFGGVDSEKIQINENSLWSGGTGFK